MPARSITIVIHNNLDHPLAHAGAPFKLTQTGARLKHGQWTDNRVPPYVIGAGDTVSFEAESDGFMTGVEGSITYQEITYGEVTLNFDVPFAGGNKCSVDTKGWPDGWAIRVGYDPNPKGNNTTWDVYISGPPAGRYHGLMKHAGTGRYVDNYEGGGAGAVLDLWWNKHYRNTIVYTESGLLYHCGTGLYLTPENGSLTEGTRVVLSSFFDALLGRVQKWEYRADHGFGIPGHDLTMCVYLGEQSTNGSPLILWRDKQTPFNAFTFVDY
ncbi:MAG TPA: hypothetical protein VFP84_31070 [Kofleriaceae bacterium]|nr:hypothetical protein [Kofleriaceae bacterium]